jgi:hypothetical protein
MNSKLTHPLRSNQVNDEISYCTIIIDCNIDRDISRNLNLYFDLTNTAIIYIYNYKIFKFIIPTNTMYAEHYRVDYYIQSWCFVAIKMQLFHQCACGIL